MGHLACKRNRATNLFSNMYTQKTRVVKTLLSTLYVAVPLVLVTNHTLFSRRHLEYNHGYFYFFRKAYVEFM